ncbi:MAG: response regulator [Candidatus Omnitrophota bacterium]|jgi:DNA-binding response OmpR family regulator
MNKKILVIDDDKLILGTLKRLLTGEGYDVFTAESGSSALEKIKNDTFNLIITDIRMPGLDGIETIKEIRKYLAEAQREAIPELVITGYDNDENRSRVDELKIAGYLSKPFDLKELLLNIENQINSK